MLPVNFPQDIWFSPLCHFEFWLTKPNHFLPGVLPLRPFLNYITYFITPLQCQAATPKSLIINVKLTASDARVFCYCSLMGPVGLISCVTLKKKKKKSLEFGKKKIPLRCSGKGPQSREQNPSSDINHFWFDSLLLCLRSVKGIAVWLAPSTISLPASCCLAKAGH